MAKDGMVSWMAASGRASVPWGDACPKFEHARIVKVFRSPISALTLILTENQNPRSLVFRAQVIWEKLAIDITDPSYVQQTDLGYALSVWAFWMQIIMMEKRGLVFCIDFPEDIDLLVRFLDLKTRPDASRAQRNSRVTPNPLLVDPRSFAHFPLATARAILGLCEQTGYEADYHYLDGFRKAPPLKGLR